MKNKNLNTFLYRIIDNNENIFYSISYIDDLYVLHIYNPNYEKININVNNKDFYEKLANMFYTLSGNIEEGCFNLEAKISGGTRYNDFYTIINSYLNMNYTFILFNVDKNILTPLSALGINNNTIWNVCSNFKMRNKGYMSKLFLHVLQLIYKKKLKNKDLTIDNLKLYIFSNNPNKEKLLNFYNKYKFVLDEKTINNKYLLMYFIL